MPNAFEIEVLAVYDWVDAQVAAASPRCDISGRCCRFKDYGHKLFLTRVEADILFRKELPTEHNVPEKTSREAVNQACPYQHNGLCTARENRPTGCRIFFCDPAYDEKCCEITEAAILQLKKLHEKYHKPWDYNELSHFFDREDREFPFNDPNERVDSKSSL